MEEDSVSIPTQSDIDDKIDKLLNTDSDSESSSSGEEDINLDLMKE